MLTYRPSWKRKLAGWSLLVLGVIGLVLPFLNGIVPLVLGLFVLREQHGWSQRSLAWCHARWPAQVDRMGALEDRLAQRCRNGTAWLRRRFGAS